MPFLAVLPHRHDEAKDPWNQRDQTDDQAMRKLVRGWRKTCLTTHFLNDEGRVSRKRGLCQ